MKQKPFISIHLSTLEEPEVQAMLDIYAPYILYTTTSFELEVPTLWEFKQRVRKVLEVTPWLVCTINEEVAGYAYASPHRSREAYQWSREVSVYVHDKFRKQGIATALYTSLVEILKVQGITNILAGIVLPNPVSISFHTHFGFQPVGIYHNVGYKKDQWCDVSWWEMFIGGRKTAPKKIVPVAELLQTPVWQKAIATGLKKIRLGT